MTGPSSRLLKFPETNSLGQQLIRLDRGCVRLWFAPGWSSSSLGGSGPGSFGRLLEAGTPTTTGSGWWGLYFDETGDTLSFTVQANGQTFDLLSAQVQFETNVWHLITLNYTSTNTAFYIDDSLVAQGNGITVSLPHSVRAGGFSLGSDSSGGNLCQGQIDEFVTLEQPCPAALIANLHEGLNPTAQLGPVTAEEELALQQARFARAQARLSSPVLMQDLDGGGAQSLLSYAETEFLIGLPSWDGTNIVLSFQNPNPECPVDLLYATNLNAPIVWTRIAQGSPFQTNFVVPYIDTNQAFFQLCYKPLLQVSSPASAVEDALLSVTNISLFSFQGTNAQLSLAAGSGVLKLGTTSGLSFVSGTNNSSSFTVAGSYTSLQTALGTLTYLGNTNYSGSDHVTVSLAHAGTNSSCVDGAVMELIIAGVNDAPVARNTNYSFQYSYVLPAPGLLAACSDVENDPLQLVEDFIIGSHGQLIFYGDGRFSYILTSTISGQVTEHFQYKVYDTHGGSLHSTSAVATLTLYVSPAPALPPAISITSPTNNSVFTQGTNIPLAVSVGSPDCQISSVSYYAGTSLIGTVASWPYSLTWTNPSPGTNALRALANGCASTGTSSVVNVTILADSDGDGVSDAQEVINGTSPLDYYNGNPPVLQILSGNFQSGAPGTTLPNPLRTMVTSSNGTLLVNAPLNIEVFSGGGSVSAQSPTSWLTNITLRTGSTGIVAAQFQLPSSTNNFSTIRVVPLPNYTNSSVSFTAVSTNQASSGSAYLEVYTPLK